MVEKLRAIPRHLKIDKRKTLDVQPDKKKSPHETINTKNKTAQKNECQNLYLCSQKNIWDSERKKLLIWEYGKNVTIAKDIINYV